MKQNKTIYFTARGLENTARVDLYAVYFNGTSLASALESRINQMEDSAGNTVNGVAVTYSTVDNAFTFTTGT